MDISYLNFDFSIEGVNADTRTYRIRVHDSPAGQAQATFALPFSDAQLEIYILRMGRVRNGRRSAFSPEGQVARDLGRQLYETIFTGPVQTCWWRSVDSANAQDKGLRLRLRLSGAPELADVPWEYLYDAARDRFLGHSEWTPIVRYTDLPMGRRPLTVEPPLRVLTLIASPQDHEPLDVEREWANVQRAVAPLQERGLIQMDRLERPTLPALQRQLRREAYHIFHFVGHGGMDVRTGESVLVLEGERSYSRLVHGPYLSAVLDDHRSLRLCLLNACEGARASRTDPFAGVAQHLVRGGMPAVIAMQFEITDEAAITLAGEFYAALADNYPVDAALAAARKSVFIRANDVEWGTPVLYLRTEDGHLFDMTPVPPDEPEVPAAATPEGADAERVPVFPPELTALRNALVTLYPTEEDARRVVDDAGLNPAAIRFSSQATNNWHAILDEAHKSGQMDALLAVAQWEYPQNEALRAAIESFRGYPSRTDALSAGNDASAEVRDVVEPPPSKRETVEPIQETERADTPSISSAENTVHDSIPDDGKQPETEPKSTAPLPVRKEPARTGAQRAGATSAAKHGPVATKPKRRLPRYAYMVAIASVLLIGLYAIVNIAQSGFGRAEPTATPTKTPEPTPTFSPTPTPNPLLATATVEARMEIWGSIPPTDAITGTAWVEPRTGITFVHVPAGEFLMGSTEAQIDYAMELCTTYYAEPTENECQRSWYEDEAPQRTVAVDAFWIMQTEVTNAQYAPFVEAGYADDQWWSEAGWSWRSEADVTEPRYWNDARFNGPQQPVVGISWYEAHAFANWLAAETDADVRLPTEAEWEKAARGTDGSHFPWGDAWDGSLVNYCDVNCTQEWKDESGNDGYEYTAPVGSYPDGESPYGVLDMAGNVWEWTVEQSGDRRVVRGGSCSDPRATYAPPAASTSRPTVGTTVWVCGWCGPPAFDPLISSLL